LEQEKMSAPPLPPWYADVHRLRRWQ